ncbi:hypothetical protein, partial [Candidatus Methylacidiphilum fumarolicum]|uniref:hypothetical protein n=1 Tax=Candidatus Methylacidiphilum fumarolicum TaxID=591154 RepID=UPI0006628E48
VGDNDGLVNLAGNPPWHTVPWALASSDQLPIRPRLCAIRWAGHSRGSGKRIYAKAKRDAAISETILLAP